MPLPALPPESCLHGIWAEQKIQDVTLGRRIGELDLRGDSHGGNCLASLEGSIRSVRVRCGASVEHEKGEL